MTNADLNGSAERRGRRCGGGRPQPPHPACSGIAAGPFNTQPFSSMDKVGAARFPSASPLVLVLGESQADESVLDKVGSLLRARPGTGAVLVVAQPSADVLRSALRSGIDDAIETYDLERQLPLAVAELVQRLENELAAAAAEAARRRGAHRRQKGWVTTVFSPKGGVGKSVVSVNLATALAKRTGKPSVIFDLDLQFGDVAVMLRLNPVHTVVDAMSAGTLLDRSLLQTFLVHHEKSNVGPAAPTAPSEAEQVDPAGMLRVLGLLQEMFENVVIDSPPHLSDVVLQAVAESNTVVFVVALDVPSVKNARLGLQAFELLQFPTEKVMLVINRADSKVHLNLGDIERALEKKVDLALPSEAVVPRSVNQGVPAFLEYPKSRFVAQLVQLAEMVTARKTAAASDSGGSTVTEDPKKGTPVDRAGSNDEPRADLMASLGLPKAPQVAKLPGAAPQQATDPTAGTAGPWTWPSADGSGLPRGPGGQGLYRRLREEIGVADPRSELMEAVRDRIHRRVLAELGPLFYSNTVDQKELRTRVDRIVQSALRAEKAPLSLAEANQLGQLVADEILGHGPIERLVRDPTVSEIMVNGPDLVYVERNGRIEATKVSFVNEAHLRHVIARIVGEVGRHIDESSPMVDARLADGSRVNAVFPPLAIGGPFLTIRKFETDPFTLEDLIDFGTLTPQVGELLHALRAGQGQRDGLGRRRDRQDHDVERTLLVHPAHRAHHHHRGRQGAPAPSETCALPGVPAAKHGGDR